MQRFEDDIDSVVAETNDMATLAVDMLERAIQAVKDGDVELADTIISDQDKIEKFDDEIEEAAIRILTIYQPTAGDTRTIATVLKSITHLERIAKYSTNIATATKYLADKPTYEVVELIGPAGDLALSLVKRVVNGFKNRSIDGFDKIPELDDRLDEAMKSDLEEIVQFINSHAGSADVCIYYISVLKFLERVGDHACKMAEKVSSMVTGKHATINGINRLPRGCPPAYSSDATIGEGALLEVQQHRHQDSYHEQRDSDEAVQREAADPQAGDGGCEAEAQGQLPVISLSAEDVADDGQYPACCKESHAEAHHDGQTVCPYGHVA